MNPGELKAFRVERKMTQGALADHLDIGRTTIVGYERGAIPIPRVVALAIAALHRDVPPYKPPVELLRTVEAKKVGLRVKPGEPLSFRAIPPGPTRSGSPLEFEHRLNPSDDLDGRQGDEDQVRHNQRGEQPIMA